REEGRGMGDEGRKRFYPHPPSPRPSSLYLLLRQLPRRAATQVFIRVVRRDRPKLVARRAIPALGEDVHEPITYSAVTDRIVQRHEIRRRDPGLRQRSHRPLAKPRVLLRITDNAFQPRRRLRPTALRYRLDDALAQALVIELRVYRTEIGLVAL